MQYNIYRRNRLNKNQYIGYAEAPGRESVKISDIASCLKSLRQKDANRVLDEGKMIMFHDNNIFIGFEDDLENVPLRIVYVFAPK